jgi:hypothetical protein
MGSIDGARRIIMQRSKIINYYSGYYKELIDCARATGL